MSIIAKAGANYEAAPAGAHPAVCVDVVDLGVMETTFGGKTTKGHKVNVVWQIDERNSYGKYFQVRRRYTLSLHKKASLRKDLESWRGRPFTDEELRGFDLEALIGIPCLLSVVQETSDGSVYANVNGVMRMAKGMQAPPVEDYVRVKDRQPTDAPGVPADDDDRGPGDDDVPF